MRSSLPPLLLVVALGCGDAGVGPPRSSDADPTLPARHDVETGTSANGKATPVVDVAGVLTDLDGPLSGVRVVIVDARGAASTLVTADSGAFSATGLTPPYDIAVLPDEGGPYVVYQGLWHETPRLEIPRGGASLSEVHRRLRIGLADCRCPTPTCTLVAQSRSPNGAGLARLDFANDDDTCTVDLDHVGWGAFLPHEPIDVSLIVAAEDRSWYGFRRLPPTPAEETPIDLGLVYVDAISSTPLVHVEASGDAAALVDWRWHAALSLDLSGMATAGAFVFSELDVPAFAMTLPAIPGMTTRAEVSAAHPRSDEEGGFAWSARAWSGDLTIGADATLPVRVGPELVHPASTGRLSRHGPGFEWTGSPGVVLSTLTVSDVTRARVVLRLFTNGRVASFGRLTELGIPRLDLGDHFLDLSTWTNANVDDLVDEDPVRRRAFDDRSRAGSSSSLRVAFQVTP